MSEPTPANPDDPPLWPPQSREAEPTALPQTPVPPVGGGEDSGPNAAPAGLPAVPAQRSGDDRELPTTASPSPWFDEHSPTDPGSQAEPSAPPLQSRTPGATVQNPGWQHESPADSPAEEGAAPLWVDNFHPVTPDWADEAPSWGQQHSESGVPPESGDVDPRLVDTAEHSAFASGTVFDEPVDPRLSAAPAAAPAPEVNTSPPVPAGPPPTHGRGVRMAIYGAGCAVIVGIIVVILVMAGGGLPPLAGGDTSDEPAPDDRLLDAAGEVDSQAYAELAAAAGTSEWFDWLYGSPADAEPDAEPIDEPDSSVLDLGDGVERHYQYGETDGAPANQNVQGQLGFTPEDADSPGVDHVTTAEVSTGTLGFTPRPGGQFSSDAPEVELDHGSTAECLGDADLGRVVAMDRAHGDGHAAHSVMAFSSGAVATAGVSGAQGGACLFLPDALTPTSVAVTPANELALITVWDTEAERGRVAVVALGDASGTYASSWSHMYPGLPNPGHFGFAKLLGLVDLEHTQAPTAIAAGTDFAGGNPTRAGADLAVPESRAEHADDVARSGFAVVASAAEDQLEWIDLSPLLSGLADAYFDDDPAGFDDPGLDAAQWPPHFDEHPDYAPTAAAQTSAPRPTSVTAVGESAYVADSDKGLTAYDGSEPAEPDAVGETELPGAATCLEPSAEADRLLATSRADQSVAWVDVEDSAAEVARTLRDERLVDPVCASDTELDDGGAAHVVSVADYGAQTLHTYRFGSGALADGTSLDLADEEFEYGGGYQPQGRPFAVSTTVDGQ